MRLENLLEEDDGEHFYEPERAILDQLGYTSRRTILDASPGAPTITLGSGQCVSVRDLADTIQRIGAEELAHRSEIAVVENPREHETIAEDFTVETTTAHDVIGFEAERTVEDTVRAVLRDDPT